MTYIIIINYNNSFDTIDCIRSLERARGFFKVIVVDNGSSSTDYLKLKEFFQTINNASSYSIDELLLAGVSTQYTLIRSEENLGFAGGNNLAIKIAIGQSDFQNILLLNNDTLVDTNFLEELTQFHKKNDGYHLIGGRIFFENKKDKIWYDGGRYNKYSTSVTHTNENKLLSEISGDENPHETDFITGCLLFIPGNALQKIGLLDESFFMYFEDLDYCLRAKNEGFKLYHVPKSMIWHKIGSSSGGKLSVFAAYWLAKNRIKIAFKHHGFLIQLSTALFYLFTRVPRFCKWIMLGHAGIIVAQSKGFIDGFKQEKKR